MLTNKLNLPEPVYRACSADDYTMGGADYSCTGLIDAPRITHLKKRHGHEVVEDVIDRIWSMFGQLGHKLLERAGADNAFLEERLFWPLLGRQISGASDIGQFVVEEGKITDYKFTSVFTAKFGDRVDDWTAQQNIYRWLWQKHGYEITELEICAFFRDWRRGESLHDKDYPPIAKIYKLEVWPMEKTENYIRERLSALIEAEESPDDQLPECTPAEMWQREPKFAVMKKGGKRATKVVDSQKEALGVLGQQKDPLEYEVQYRPADRTRCENYCSVSPFCSQFREYLKTKEGK